MKSRRAWRVAIISLLTVSALALVLLEPLSKSSAQSGQASSSGGVQNSVAIASPAAAQALGRLQSAIGSKVSAHVARETGFYDFVRATGTSVLSANIGATPEARARAFLGEHGGLVGMTDAERQSVSSSSALSAAAASTLQVAKIYTDRLGATHVRFKQLYRGQPVFGAQLIVHMNSS